MWSCLHKFNCLWWAVENGFIWLPFSPMRKQRWCWRLICTSGSTRYQTSFVLGKWWKDKIVKQCKCEYQWVSQQLQLTLTPTTLLLTTSQCLIFQSYWPVNRWPIMPWKIRKCRDKRLRSWLGRCGTIFEIGCCFSTCLQWTSCCPDSAHNYQRWNQYVIGYCRLPLTTVWLQVAGQPVCLLTYPQLVQQLALHRRAAQLDLARAWWSFPSWRWTWHAGLWYHGQWCVVLCWATSKRLHC